MQSSKPPLVTISPKPLNCVKHKVVVASPPPSPSWSSFTDDEGEDEVAEDEDVDACWARYGRRSRRFPPPLPLLARTGKLTCRKTTVVAVAGEDRRFPPPLPLLARTGVSRRRCRFPLPLPFQDPFLDPGKDPGRRRSPARDPRSSSQPPRVLPGFSERRPAHAPSRASGSSLRIEPPAGSLGRSHPRFSLVSLIEVITDGKSMSYSRSLVNGHVYVDCSF
ncbi:hypothetical protein GW17_00006832 [Ensete ventricosum]|nr:hypothetical protein GW17_00006832 [Ensete ventricosum]